MRFSDANRPEPAGDPRPKVRYLETDATGNAGVDGYSRIARRPRYPAGMMGSEPDMIPEARADRIEGFFSGSPFGLDADGDYDAGTDTDNDGD